MGSYHDMSATKYGDKILNKIRTADKEFKQIFSTSISRTGDWDWPRPDYVCYDAVLNASYALEFKPPAQSKREYLTGLGQSLAYLQKHAYSGLIVPTISDDGFKIGDFIADTLKSKEFDNIATSLYIYNDKTEDIKLVRAIDSERTLPKGVAPKFEKTFWCWWRDISNYELYDLLNLSFHYAEKPGDIYTDYIYPEFYKNVVAGKTKTWEGTARKKSGTIASMTSEKQNYKIPLVQLGLWSSSEGRLTDEGINLLELGKRFGADSKLFLDRLTYLILVDGRHLDLINQVVDFQKTPESNVKKANEYKANLDKYLSDNGSIGKRKPSAVTTGAKETYVRDEPKLWNKLGLLTMKSSHSYYFPNEGYKFNWERITDALIQGK